MVTRDGLDRALKTLRENGVYVTYEEFRGRAPIVRGATTIEVCATDFDNPHARRDFLLTTGGSTGRAMSVHQDLDNIAASGPLQMLMLEAWGVLNLPAVMWLPMLPGGALRFILQRARFGGRSRAWYSQHGWFDSTSWFKYDLATLYSIFWMNAFGLRLPIPTIAKSEQALAIARHVRRILDEDGACLIYCGVSAALRVALAAGESGIDLTGTTMRVGGEPVTAAKVAPIERAGARVLPAYGAIETGTIGLGCPRPLETDHVHLVTDTTALIAYPYRLETGDTVQAFNLTSLIDASPKVLLNYQIDDHGVVDDRRCGCPLHACGYTTSLHTIRSYSKLLSEAVTFSGSDMQAILEDTLPARFGGTALDYQLLEEEDAAGISRLYLIISPRITVADEREPVRIVLEAVRAFSPCGDATGIIWQQAGTVAVLRQEPIATARGKQPMIYRRRANTRRVNA